MKYLIDIGSSTIKLYERNSGIVTLVEAQTFDFKEDFNPEEGLSVVNKEILYSFFSEISERFSLSRNNTKLYATGIFREIINKQNFIEEFYANTHLLFNIVSHELEAFYLEKAWIGQYTGVGSLIVINIGGKTTELIFYNDGHIVDKKMLSIGVGSILKQHTLINEEYSLISLSELVDNVRKTLPKVDGIYDTAIYTGGELTYMKIAGYSLEDNTIFDDIMHPFIITLDNYCAQNQRVFSEITITDLHNMMPSNPTWMDGARACSAIAQAICMHYHVKNIVPSDSNLIDGVNVQEGKSVVVCGSFNKHLNKISQIIDKLKSNDINVLSPLTTEVVGREKGFLLFKNDSMINKCTWSVEALHLRAMESCDTVVVCNFDGYVGTKTSLEIGYAYKCGKKIVFLQDNEIVKDFDIPSEIGLLQI